ncbi:MAG: hypothetical protein CMP48_26780 [Rickettsiales bacterium]|nr:hypothetical protein [Rickettsiales bacterium]
MGQKANIITLRNSFNNLNFYRLDINEFLYGSIFLKSFTRLLQIRKVFLVNSNLNFFENKIFFNFNVFFRTSKVLSLKNLKVVNKQLKKSNLPLFLKELSYLKKNLIIIKFTLTNLILKSKDKENLVFIFFKKFKRMSTSLFPRRFNFFLDFIKLSCLFGVGALSLNFFIKVIVEIFRILQKKKHARFLLLMKQLFNSLISNKNFKKSNIMGVKFIVGGKLKGKPRSSNYVISLGQIPLQSLGKNIEFAKAHAFTVYGVFGLKIWVYRSSSSNTLN